MEEERKWIDVILKTSDIYNYVQKRTLETDKKRKRVLDYLNLLKSYSNRCIRNRGSRFERLYRNIFFYRKYVIKEKDIPESYFKSYIERAQREGKEFTLEDKEQIKQKVIYDQKRTLDEWIDYFLYGNGRFFEMYKQFWAFQGLQKLGNLNKETMTFGKKNKNTVNPIASLDEAALEKAINLMERYISDGCVIDDIKEGFNSYNFKKLYEYSLKAVLKNRENKTTEGIWKKYGKDSDYKALMNDIRGSYTGWCTERDSWAKDYLSKGDMYIYYTKDVNGNYVQPRLAIRVVDNDIVEVRGTEANQNVELSLFDVLHEKMKEFNFSEEFFRKEVNMKCLTLIDKKIKNGIELDNEELSFIYQINGVVESFGQDVDPRLRQIIMNRDIKSDLSKIFDIKYEEVALTKDELRENTKVFFGDLDYFINDGINLICNDENYKVNNIYIPKYIIGNMNLNVPLENITLPKLVTGNFDIFCPKVLNRLSLPKVMRHLSVYKLEDAIEIEVKGNPYDVRFYDLCNCGEIKFPENINGIVQFRNLMSVDKMYFPEVMRRSIEMPKVYFVYDLVFPKILGENLIIPNLKSKVILPEKIGGFIEYSKKERSVIK